MPDRPSQLSAIPSVRARVVAFLAILVAGICGSLIGWSLVQVQCEGDCDVPAGLGAVAGASAGAGGVAVVATLTLRAMGEWRRIQEDEGGPAQDPASSRRNPSA